MAILTIQFSHSGLHYLNSFHNYGSFNFSIVSLRQTAFSKDGHSDRSHSPWSHSVTLIQTCLTSSAGPFPSPSHLEHRETLVMTSDNRMRCDDAILFLTQTIILSGSFALLSWDSHSWNTPPVLSRAQEPHRDPLTHQLVKNSWCLSSMVTSFSKFKTFLHTSRDYLTKWSQKEKDSTMWCLLYVESKWRLKWIYLQNRNRLMDIENKIVVAKGVEGGERDGMGGWG